MERKVWDISGMDALRVAAREVLSEHGGAAAGRPTDAVHSLDILFRHLPRKVSQRVLSRSPRSAHAAVLALYGDLGFGKTTFTQEIGKLLRVKDAITSPTFVVMKRYETEDARFQNLIHVDAYRLESALELEVLGFTDWIERPDSLIIIEWADKVEELLPDNATRLRFSLGEKGRMLEVSKT